MKNLPLKISNDDREFFSKYFQTIAEKALDLSEAIKRDNNDQILRLYVVLTFLMPKGQEFSKFFAQSLEQNVVFYVDESLVEELRNLAKEFFENKELAKDEFPEFINDNNN